MPHLSLKLFGPFQASLDDQPLTHFRSVKNQALLAYLALEADRAHARAALADLLWPEEPAGKARLNLRQALFQLRSLLQPTVAQSAAEFLLITPQTVQFNRQALHTLDGRDFAQLLDACRDHHAGAASVAAQSRCPLCRSRLQQAVELYRGEFLAAMFVENSPDLEEWIRWQRQHTEVRVLEALSTLALGFEQNQDYANAYQYALRQIKLDPLREEGQRQVIRLLALRGQNEAAIAHYDRLRRLLRKELNAEPAVETVALAKQIRRGGLKSQEHGSRGVGEQRSGGDKSSAQDIPALPYSPSPPPPYSPTVFHNLPTQLTTLVGRAREVTEICARLQQPGVRLVTVVGAGGMGKTRLALAVGHAILAAPAADQPKSPISNLNYPDGVFYVPLAPLSDPGAIAPTLASTLGLNLQGDPQQAVIQALRNKQLLLILDNFEHLLAAAGFVVDLLQAAPALQILVTSRERLHVRGEHLYSIPALAYDPGQIDIEAVAALSSVQLFLQCAQRTEANFVLDAENMAAVLRICRLVQGMPLGLELAAAWVGTLPIPAIADAISQRYDFLAADWRDAPERQRSMRAVFEWSWQLLNQSEQQVLRQLAVFHGGFTAVAAQAVTATTLPVLTRLVHKSLVQWDESDHNAAAGRYRLHELLRQFAAEKLDQLAAERTTVQTMHSRFYLTYLAQRTLRLVRREPQAAGAEIQRELDNIRQAWTWAASQGDVAALDQAAYGWWQFCSWCGLISELRQSLAVAIQGVRAWLAQGDSQQFSAGQQLLSKLLAIHANLLFAQGVDEEMAAEAEAAIALGQTYGSIEGESLGYFVLGRAYQEFEKISDAIAMWQKTIALAQADQQSPTPSPMALDTEWMAHLWLRGAAMALDDYAGGRAHMIQALAICQALGHVRGELSCLTNLAWNDFVVGDYSAAQQRFEQGFALACTLRHRWAEMATCSGLGEVMRRQGRYGQALAWWERSLAIAVEYSPYDEALLMASFVRLYSYLGDQAGAAEAWRSRLFQLLERTKLPKDCQRQALLAAAVQAYYAGELPSALTYAEQVRQLTGPGEILTVRADVLIVLGHVQAALQQSTAAAASYTDAIACYTKIGNQSDTTEARAGLAALALAQGERDQAQRWVDAILPILAAQPRAGLTTPFFTYLTCYRVLTANQDPRAPGILEQGWRLLQDYAIGITDPAQRRDFLEGVKVHRELQALYAAVLLK